MSHQIDPPSYPAGEPLPECATCRERSYDAHSGKCLNPSCPSHTACEWCGEREAVVILLGPTEDRLCLPCGGQAIRAMLAGSRP